MKRIYTQIGFFLLVLIFVIILMNSIVAGQISEDLPFYQQESFKEKATIAIVTAILAFLSSYVIVQIKQKREPKKQLSYDTKIRKGLIEVESDIKENVTIKYREHLIENLYHVACDIENTGNSVVKNQYVRFEFPKGTKIIDFLFEPKPEPELGVERLFETGLRESEIRYKIGHIERKQHVGFRFILTGINDIQPIIYPYNEAGDVEFVPRSISKISNERDDITRFVTLILLFLIIPELLYNLLPRTLDNFAVGIVKLAILIYMFPFIKPFAKAVAGIISKYSYEGEVKQQIEIAPQINLEKSTSVKNINITTK